jgi:glycosyltransferase involved in cell wall biosynthesis
MISLPTISVVTPSYNQAAYLEATLRSVIAQRRDVEEYCVLDGGSSDGSATLIARHAAAIDHWQSTPDGGQAAAIAAGFARSTGDILMWINSDDLIAPGALARVRRAFADHPEWDVLTGYSVFLDEEGAVTRVNLIESESPAWLRRGILHVCQQTCYFRRQLYEQVGGIDRSLHCMLDTELWLRFFAAGGRWGHIPAVLGGFRQHALMKGRTWLARYAEERQTLAARYPAYRPSSSRWSMGRGMHGIARMASAAKRPWSWRWSRDLIGRRLADIPPEYLEPPCM